MNGITLSVVKSYFLKWSDKSLSLEDSYSTFMQMLQNKAFFAGREKKPVFAYNGLKTFTELNQMLMLADDNRDYLTKQFLRE